MNGESDPTTSPAATTEEADSASTKKLPGEVGELLPVTREQLVALFQRLPEEVKKASSSTCPREQEMFRLFDLIIKGNQDHLTRDAYFASTKSRRSTVRLNNLRSDWNHVAKKHLRYKPDASRPQERFFPACKLDHREGLPENTIHFVWQHGSKSRSPVESKKRRDSAAEGSPSTPRPAPMTSGHNLKSELTHFIGREKEKEAVKDRLKNHPMVTLTGVGGSGKTRLAIEVGLELQSHYPDGVRMVELARVTDPKQIPSVIAEALKMPHVSGQDDALDQLVLLLANRNLLLIVDNCEHVADGCAKVLNELLSRRGPLRVLATSRVVLNVRGEGWYAVPTLNVPPDGNLLSLADLGRNESIQLFCEYARGGSKDFKLTAHNSQAVVDICRRVDGIPMCIVLAASRVKYRSSPEEVAKSLEKTFDALTEENPIAPQRHQTAKALIDWSYDLLTPGQRTVFNRLAVLRGGWSEASAQAVCSGPDQSPKAVEKDHEALDHFSLINSTESPDGTKRYRLLEPLREYAWIKLEQSNEARQAHQRHLEYFIRVAREAKQHAYGEQDADRVWRLEEELHNIRHAIEWSLNLKENGTAILQIAMEMVADLSWFWIESGRRAEGNRHLLRFLDEHLAKEPTRARCRALTALCTMCPVAGDSVSPANKRWAEENLTIAKRIDDPQSLADAFGVLAALNESRLNWTTSHQYWKDSHNAWKSMGNVRGMCNGMLGMARTARTDRERAEIMGIAQACLKAGSDQGDYFAVSSALHHLASEARLANRFPEARTMWERCLEANHKIAFVAGYETALTELMKGYLDDPDGEKTLALRARHLEKAEGFFEDAREEAHRVRHGSRLLASLSGLVRCARIAQDTNKARMNLGRITDVLNQSNESRPDSSPVLRAAFDYLQLGDGVPALRWAEHGVKVARDIGHRDDLRWGTTLVAMVLARLGRHEESVEHFRGALDMARESGHTMTVAFSIYMFASELILAGHVDAATALAKELLTLEGADLDLGWRGTRELLRGGLALADRKYPVAGKQYKVGLSILVKSGRIADILVAIQALGMYAGGKADWQNAATLFGAAGRSIGVDFVFAYNPQYALFSGMARHWLGAPVYDRLFEAGKAMPLQDTIKLATSIK